MIIPTPTGRNAGLKEWGLGKPCAGKSPARFDEGESSAATPVGFRLADGHGAFGQRLAVVHGGKGSEVPVGGDLHGAARLFASQETQHLSGSEVLERAQRTRRLAARRGNIDVFLSLMGDARAKRDLDPSRDRENWRNIMSVRAMDNHV